MNESNDLLGIKTYRIAELRAVAHDNRHAVRDEALRRHAKAARRLALAKAQVDALEALLKEVM